MKYCRQFLKIMSGMVSFVFKLGAIVIENINPVIPATAGINVFKI